METQKPLPSAPLFNFTENQNPLPSGQLFNFAFRPFETSVAKPIETVAVTKASSDPNPSKRRATRKMHQTDLDDELAIYLKTLSFGVKDTHGADVGTSEELRTTPLFSWAVKSHVSMQPSPTIFTQYGLLGQELESSSKRDGGPHPTVFLNTNTPWSAFICGSQGSGKSYSLSCILENCLLPSPHIGKMPSPLAGMLFHYDTHASEMPCEAAFLASRIPVTVLVSPSNIWRMRKVYGNVPGAAGKIKVVPLQLHGKHLNTERMLKLMAFGDKDGSIPLYMESIIQILKKMAIEAQGKPGLNYAEFIRRVKDMPFSRDQNGPLGLRLQLLESFMDTALKSSYDLFKNRPGTLTIVDLTDPFVDPASACVLFDICLALFLEDQAQIGRIVALDEAHKFMKQSSASEIFTDSLLTVIREQRHKGARVVIATQEPTISPKLLDLCSMTFVHRFTSPEWLATLKDHLAAASSIAGKTKEDIQELFREIVNLNVGESLLFSPSAMLDVVDGTTTKLGMTHLKFKTRPRLTTDGGKSVMATVETPETSGSDDSAEYSASEIESDE